MEFSIHIDQQLRIPKVGKVPVYLPIVLFVFLLAVLQDYIYSTIQLTGFYIAESLLYNTFWILFIPLTFCVERLTKIIYPKYKYHKLFYNLGIGITFSFLHIALFAALFVLVSNLVFSPSHRFSTIFNSAFSNQFYIALLWHTIFPIIYTSKRISTHITGYYPEKIKLKAGTKIISTKASSIQFISTDRPYSIVYTTDQKFVENKSLKEFETELNPTIFLRVHRSTIINSAYIKALKSRSNGDYDAYLEKGQIIRLSRHYRHNWHQLLQ